MSATSSLGTEASQILLIAPLPSGLGGRVLRAALHLGNVWPSLACGFLALGTRQPTARWQCWFCCKGLSINLVPSILISHLVDSPFPHVSTIEGEVLMYYVTLGSVTGVEWYLVANKALCTYSLEMIFGWLSAIELGSQWSLAVCSPLAFSSLFPAYDVQHPDHFNHAFSVAPERTQWTALVL